MNLRHIAIALAAVSTIAMTGCGSDQSNAIGVAEKFMHKLDDKDIEGATKLIAPEQIKRSGPKLAMGMQMISTQFESCGGIKSITSTAGELKNDVMPISLDIKYGKDIRGCGGKPEKLFATKLGGDWYVLLSAR